MKHFFSAKAVITNITGTFTIIALIFSMMAPLTLAHAQGQSEGNQEQSELQNDSNDNSDNGKKDDTVVTVPENGEDTGTSQEPTDDSDNTAGDEQDQQGGLLHALFSAKPDVNPHDDVKGSITVCKVILDAQGNVITGSVGDTFSVQITDSSEAVVGTASFVTPLTLGDDVISNIHGDDAQCETIGNLSLSDDLSLSDILFSAQIDKTKDFHYGAETGANSALWEDPLYIELPGKANVPVGENDLLQTYGAGDRSDGTIELRDNNGGNDKTLVVVNKLKAVVDVPTATVSATKIICPSESELPNWSGGADITATTATDFIAAHPTCHIQSPWNFQWGNQNVGDMGGDYRGEAPAESGYTTFSSTAAIPLTENLTQIRLREVLPEGYISFSNSTTSGDNTAEFWCGSDVLNYDNWEWVTPQADGTIHCIAFNVPTPPTPPQNSCALPDSLDDSTAETINFDSGETTLQQIMNDKGYPSVNVVTDQKQYQVWNVTPGQEVSVTTTFLDKYAGHGNVFGYYKNGNIATFTPLFRTGTAAGYEATDLATSGDTYDFSVPSSSVTTIGFAIKSFDGALTAVNATQNSLNVGGADRAVVYNPATNIYVLGFEDISDGTADNDFNDVVVDVNIGCKDEPPAPTKLKVHIFKYLQGAENAAQIPNDSTAPNFPMIATYDIAGIGTNLDPGDGYVLGNGGGVGGSDDGLRYAANTIPLSAGDKYGTHEVTDGSVVVGPNSEACPEGKYRLLGYKTGTSLALAQDAGLSTENPFFSNLATDEYVIVVNQPCPQNNGGEGEHTAQTIVVRAADLAPNLAAVAGDVTKWFFYNDETDTIDNTLGSFVTGPGTAPIGTGSAQMSVTGTQRRNIATYHFKDVLLSNITTLTFATYAQSAGDGALGLAERAPYLNFNVDFNNSDTWQGRLVYVPSVNGTVTPDTWQTWNTTAGLWTYSKYAANGNKWPDNNTNEYRSWSDILAAFPNIQTRSTDSWFGFRVGEPYPNGFTGNVDDVVIGIQSGINTNTTTYDFEPTQVQIDDTNDDTSQCSDKIDNDGDGLTDEADPGCHTDGNAANSASYVASDDNETNTPPSGGSTSRHHSSHSGSSSTITTATNPIGEVLGASTCTEYITSYIKLGKKNNPDDVSRLQTFLNEYMGLSLPVTGLFDNATFNGVKLFQIKESKDVLQPWVGSTLKNASKATGWVYKTTRHRINMIKCPELNLPMPGLTIDQTDL